MSTFFIGVVAPSFIAAPLGVAIYKCRSTRQPEGYFVSYLLLCAVFNIIAKLTARYNNLPLLHLYTVLEFCLLCGFFRMLFSGKTAKTILLALIILFPAFAMLYVAATNSLHIYNALPRFLSSTILTTLSISFFISDLRHDLHTTNERTYSSFSFIIIVGLLLYFSSCSTLFGLSNYLLFDNNILELDSFIWSIHASFMIIMYLTFALAYLTIKRR